MAATGKTGADAIYRAAHKIVIVLSAWEPKFRAVVAVMVAGGNLSASEAAVITAFLDSLAALNSALKKVADYSGIS